MPTEFKASERVCCERIKVLEISPHALVCMLRSGYSITKNPIAFTSRLAGAYYDQRREVFVLKLQDSEFPVVEDGMECCRLEPPTVKILDKKDEVLK